MAKKIQITLTPLEVDALEHMLRLLQFDLRTSKFHYLIPGKTKPAARRVKNKVYQAWLLLQGKYAP